MRTLSAIVGLVLPLLASGCVPVPKENYRVDQIPQITSLKEIMRVQAHAMDPLFGKRKQAAFTPGEFAQMADAARRVQVSSATIRDKFSAGRNPGFAADATALNQHAGELLAAAEAQDAGHAAAALRATRDTCHDCHHEYR